MVAELPENYALPSAVRDFFFATEAQGLEVAFQRLCLAVSEPGPAIGDWEQEEFAFNRCFIGPGTVIAPPFASVYLDPEPLLMGRATLLARQVYSLLGLESPWRDSLPDDHLSLELDALMALGTLAGRYDDSQLQELYRFFLQDHLCVWAAEFVDRLSHSHQVTPAIAFVARHLLNWLHSERDCLDSAGLSHAGHAS